MPQIRTLCRIKPTAEYYPEFEASRNTLHLRVPEVLREVKGDNAVRPRATVSHEFHFDYIFKNTATQEEVFDVAAKSIVEGFLNGYNGTIFAYGQTGTGKTFTVEGSAKQYKQRGLEPRSLSMIYKGLEKRTEEDISVHISFLEIYQESGYDLLNPGARTQSLVTPFPRVSVMEGQGGVWTVRNLSVHYAATEEVAQNLLLQGQANRRVAATTVHDRSSRSHAVFTIQLSAKKPGSDVIVKSKLHLVDLAGSERVSKTGADGSLLLEAKSINLSLHYLETVIIALQGEGNRGLKRQNSAGNNRNRNSQNSKRPYTADPSPRATRYVPYRNSLLTMVLRDSLGGNCMTCMIATISLEYANLGETLSTCRFAGRVACIANSVSRNEEVDEKSLVKKLRKRVAELETELACLLMEKEETNFTWELMNTKLTDEDKIECHKIIEKYIGGQVNDPVSEGITNPYKFRECMKILKKMVVDGIYNNPANHNPDGSVNLDINHVNTPTINPENSPKRRHSFDEGDSRKRSHVDSSQHSSGQHHRHRQRNDEKTVSIPITYAWGEDKNYQSEPEQPIRRPRNRQRRSQNRPMGDPDTDKEEERKNFEELRLSEMLAPTVRRRRHYRSPFEKKRVKEIKRLNEKVETMQKDQIDKEGELVQMKLSLAEQELDLMEEQIKTKLTVTQEQLADQHAYVQQLKSNEADSSLIKKEAIVEQHLKKKQDKANRKIEAIEEKRRQLYQHSEEVKTEMSKVKPTLKDQYGKYRNRDGSLNTRQVFDMLRTEEKKQEKIQSQMEHERMLMLSQHLELKEAATRQKLREFKDMLRMSHSAGFPEGHGGGENGFFRTVTAPDFGEPERSKAKEEVGLEDIDGRKSPLRTVYTRDSRTTHLQNEDNVTSRSMLGGESRLTEKPAISTVPESSRPVSRQSVRSTRSVIPDSDFYAKKKQEKDPTVRWESPYSRPSTACSNAQPNFDVSKSVNGEEPEFGYNSLTDDYKSTCASKRSVTAQEESEGEYDGEDEIDVYETMMPSEYIHGMSTKEKFDGRKMGLASTTFDLALKQMLESQDQEMYPSMNGYDQYARTSQPGYSQSPVYYSGSDTVNPYLQPMRLSRDSSFDRALSRKTKSRGKSSVHEQNREYEMQRIYGAPLSRKSRGRSRDRNQLTSDDDDEVRKSQVRRQRDKSLDEWEKRMLMKSRKATPVKPAGRKVDSDNELEREAKMDGYSNWGPQTKHASIAGRLANMSLTSPGSSAKGSKRLGYGGMMDDYAFEPRSDEVIYEEGKSPRVKAIPDEEAESSYMEKLQVQKDRVSRIRKARHSAEVIQKAWRKYQARKKRF